MLLLMMLPMLLYLLLAVGVLYVGLRFVRAFERRGVARAELEALQEQVAQLIGEVERTTAAVAELEDGQRFTTRLLAERGGAPPPHAPDASPSSGG